MCERFFNSFNTQPKIENPFSWPFFFATEDILVQDTPDFDN